MCEPQLITSWVILQYYQPLRYIYIVYNKGIEVLKEDDFLLRYCIV